MTTGTNIGDNNTVAEIRKAQSNIRESFIVAASAAGLMAKGFYYSAFHGLTKADNRYVLFGLAAIALLYSGINAYRGYRRLGHVARQLNTPTNG